LEESISSSSKSKSKFALWEVETGEYIWLSDDVEEEEMLHISTKDFLLMFGSCYFFAAEFLSASGVLSEVVVVYFEV